MKLKITLPLLILCSSGLYLNSCTETSEPAEKDLLDELLLKDWFPRSVYKLESSNISTAKYPAIDMHAHAYALNEAELDERIAIMDETGIERSVVLTGTTGAEFDSLNELHSKYSDRFDMYVGIDYTGYDEDGWSQKVVDELRRTAAAGAVGIGEVHDKGGGLAPGMHPDDLRMDPIFEEAAELGMPVNLHVAEPVWMYEPKDSTNDGLTRAYTWRVKNQDQIVGKEGMIEILDRTLGRHPNTIFVAAHLANTSNDFSLIADLFDKHSNLYADMSARFAEFSTIPRTTAEFFEKYQDRILYGTDYGWETFDNNTDYGNNTTTRDMFRMTFRVLETPDEHFYMTDLVGYKWPMYGLNLSDDALRKIYRENALQLIENGKE